MKEVSEYLILCASSVAILAICILLMLRNYTRIKNQFEALKESFDSLNRLNEKLRMDRHDYLNHLQVVYGLMELEEYDEMSSYLKKVYKELLKTGKAIKTSKAAINALFAAKMAEAEKNGVELVIEVKSALKNLDVEDWELCKILSNLIDNAMKALEDSEKEEKRIRIDIMEDREMYVFSVENNGPEIPEHLQKKIFQKGFSSKKEEGHGMGLSIVTEILEKNGGNIELKSDETETVFTVFFKKGA